MIRTAASSVLRSSSAAAALAASSTTAAGGGGSLLLLVAPRSRGFSTTAGGGGDDELVSTDLDASSGIATVTMQRPPVNSMSLEMCQALSAAVRTASEDKKMQALVLQSSNPSIFSAGLDLTEMHEPDSDRLSEFWTSFQNLYVDLYGTRLATVAAIEGHAPAAGCMLALSCDYRIMAGVGGGGKSGTIGLNETKVGIVAPTWLGQMMIDTVGRRRAELALSLGTLYGPDEALDIGLVDRVVEKETVREAALEAAAEFNQIPPPARVASKMMIRKERIDTMLANRQDDLDHFVRFITNEKTQKSLGGYLAMLMKKKEG